MNSDRSTVSIVKGAVHGTPWEYTEDDLATVRQMIEKSLNLIGGLTPIIGQARTVVVKPNLVEVPVLHCKSGKDDELTILADRESPLVLRMRESGAELVRSKRGPDGGFALSRPAGTISLADIFRAVDGPLADVHDESLRGLEYPAPAEALPEVWMAIRGSLRRVLETVSVADLAAGDINPQVAELAAEYRRDTAARH